MNTPTPASPELVNMVTNVLYDEIWNDDNPPEQSTQLDCTKEHRVWRRHQHLLNGLTTRDFQMLVDKFLDEEITRIAIGWKRIDELRAAADSKAKERASQGKKLPNQSTPQHGRRTSTDG